MNRLFRLTGAVRRDPGVDAWFIASDDALRQFARPWFERLRECGPDIRELLHDGCPTACVEDAAFAYVNAFRDHVNVGFFYGASLDDPARLLVGAGKRMRHVKVRWGQQIDAGGLNQLIAAAYQDIRLRIQSAD